MPLDRQIVRDVDDVCILHPISLSAAPIVEILKVICNDFPECVNVFCPIRLVQRRKLFEKLIRKVNRKSPRLLCKVFGLPLERPIEEEVSMCVRRTVELDLIWEQRTDPLSEDVHRLNLSWINCHSSLLWFREILARVPAASFDRLRQTFHDHQRRQRQYFSELRATARPVLVRNRFGERNESIGGSETACRTHQSEIRDEHRSIRVLEPNFVNKQTYGQIHFRIALTYPGEGALETAWPVGKESFAHVLNNEFARKTPPLKGSCLGLIVENIVFKPITKMAATKCFARVKAATRNEEVVRHIRSPGIRGILA